MLYYEFEIAKASNILVGELFDLKPGETFIITADTESDSRVVKATASAAFSIDAKPMVIWLATPQEVGKAADRFWPSEALLGALKQADAWVEFNSKNLLYSTPYDLAMKENKKLRFLCLSGLNVDMMVRCIGRVNYPVLNEFMEKIADMTRNAEHVHVTNPSGSDVKFNMPKTPDGKPDPNRPYTARVGYAKVPGAHMMGGQIGGVPDLDTINGTIVFDGSIGPVPATCGILEEPVRMTIEQGTIVEVEGGRQAREFEAFLKSFNHPRMLKMAHFNYGFNPGAKLTGNTVEDERIWGCTQWGIGNLDARLFGPDGVPAPSHTDGNCLNSSVWLDDKQILDNGKVVDPDLVKLARQLGKS
jgi:leucyl aminopeptidase (aminopeptidase T)